MMRQSNMTGRTNIAIVFRSAALFAILYQFRLIADDLADTPVFATALAAAFAAAVFLARLNIGGKKTKPAAAVIAIVLIPWIARAFIAVPGAARAALLSPGRVDALTVSLDSLLLNFDRNNFVSLLPFYWAAVSTWFSIRSRVFLRAAVITDTALLIAVFSIARVSDIAIYRWPIVMIVLFAGIAFAQILTLLFSLPPEIRLRKSETIPAIAVLLFLVFLGGLIFLKPSQERAAEKGGGLLEPKLFSFDFSQFLRLDPEISMNDDLILIVKKDPNDEHILLRRSVLSGYSKKQGFYRLEEIDEQTHPQRLPARPENLSPAEFKLAQRVYQEYFLVNFDAAAFVGIKEPAEIIPYENWDSSSFKSAYSVESLASAAGFTDLAQSVYNADGAVFWPGPAEHGLSEKEFAIYTAYGGDERIRSYAEEITEDHDRYSDKVQMIHDHLRYGEYRYSLRPGIAPDGDQLAYFLFQTKKGYCSYYAFAMVLMLRSLGIPARVAAGFFIDPESGVFDYYPVRSDMAHAWVEVSFPGYGWIEYDPTPDTLAEGEEFRFSAGVDPDLLERLMREILENRSRLRPKTGQDSRGTFMNVRSLVRLSAALLKKIALPLLILFLIITFIVIRCGFLLLSFIYRFMGGQARLRTIALWKHTRRRLRLAGLGCPSSLAESEWALHSDALVKGTYSMYLESAAARFAPEYGENDFVSTRNIYRLFSGSYRKTISRRRRFLAWILPPLALVCTNIHILRPKQRAGSLGLAGLLVLAFLAGTGEAQNAGTDPLSGADELYNSAIEAQYAEYWERAIDLFREGGFKYPGDPRFPRSLGNLYYSRSLYSLAWDEYRKAEQIDPLDPNILSKLANTAGALNRDKTSVEYLERLLMLEPDDKEAISNLGWMYYKVHRLEDGERLLTEALDYFGDDADLAMTLGTVYSDMYRYDEGRYWYKKAIVLGEMWRGFVSVAHYNLSILESRFHYYDRSMDEANASLDSQNRASGLLSRGELYLRRLDLEKAQADYQTAREMDDSPLAKLSLAQTYQISGRLEEARLYARDCLKVGDHSWMMNYGIDPIRYKRDIHEILYKTYSGLAETGQFMPCGTPGELIRSLSGSISFRFYSAVHRRLYQKYSLAAGDAYSAETGKGESPDYNSPPLDQLVQYYNAFETYPGRAIAYLNKARNFETAIIPASEPSHDLEEGILLKKENLLVKALDTLDPVWERELISQCYREFAKHSPGPSAAQRKAARQAAAEELFALNRGALRQAGISLPLEIRLHYTGESGGEYFRRKEKALLGTLAKAGFAPTHLNVARFRLDITVSGSSGSGYTASCDLADTEGVEKSLRRIIPLRSLSGADIRSFAVTLGNAVFTVE